MTFLRQEKSSFVLYKNHHSVESLFFYVQRFFLLDLLDEEKNQGEIITLMSANTLSTLILTVSLFQHIRF
ncbi:hypothetical protein EQG57_17810 [Priestia megaterium NBRC 15308 = ATCC 14581]|nr:hypothetical protein EQG57_17810 [Priestia megaterium NBRC 15308 = ATCC 14581]